MPDHEQMEKCILPLAGGKTNEYSRGLFYFAILFALISLVLEEGRAGFISFFNRVSALIDPSGTENVYTGALELTPILPLGMIALSLFGKLFIKIRRPHITLDSDRRRIVVMGLISRQVFQCHDYVGEQEAIEGEDTIVHLLTFQRGRSLKLVDGDLSKEDLDILLAFLGHDP
ncbi:MAG: hypothetical protein HQL50_11150 [Magnetococcales bacterium]|nr:hypothetical protein [Magnetococcales bacterium]